MVFSLTYSDPGAGEEAGPTPEGAETQEVGWPSINRQKWLHRVRATFITGCTVSQFRNLPHTPQAQSRKVCGPRERGRKEAQAAAIDPLPCPLAFLWEDCQGLTVNMNEKSRERANLVVSLTS